MEITKKMRELYTEKEIEQLQQQLNNYSVVGVLAVEFSDDDLKLEMDSLSPEKEGE